MRIDYGGLVLCVEQKMLCVLRACCMPQDFAFFVCFVFGFVCFINNKGD
jgi:hypothetical protein